MGGEILFSSEWVTSTVCLSVCISLNNYFLRGLSSFDLLFSKVWERLDSQLPKEALSNRTVIGDSILRPKTASCSEAVGRQFTAHYDGRHCSLYTLYHNINSRLMVKAPMQKTLYTAIVYICNDFIHTGNALDL